SYVESNNNIGTIYVERVDATNSSGTLTYTTGISGTQGVETTNPDGTTNPNDTQNIVVNTSSATLNINGAGGVDKFNIEASSFTKTLTIAGNLGTVPNYEEAKNNYDSVRIDLSKTSGVDLNISNLLVSNPNDEGIIITASKGADNITLVAGANHDVIEFNAGGGTSGQKEAYDLDLGTLRLGQGQSVTIDGLTITNISGFTNGGANVNTAAVVLTAEDIATIIAGYLKDGDLSVQGKFGGVTTSASASKFVSVSGMMESLAGKGWADATTGKVDASASGTTITIQNSIQQNVTDIDLTANISGNGKTNGIGAQAGITPDFVKGQPETDATVSGTAITFTGCTAGSTSAETFDVGISIDGVQNTLTFTVANDASVTANTIATLVQTVIDSGTFTADANVTALSINGAAYDSGKADDYKALFELPEGYSFSGGTTLKVDDVTTTASTTVVFSQTVTAGTSGAAPANKEVAGVAWTPEATGQIVIDFGDGLLAGQSYSFMGKTVLATKDLKGEDIAEAFAFGSQTSSGVDGAVVLGEWKLNFNAAGSTAGATSGIIPAKCLFDIDADGKLIVMDSVAGAESGLVGIDKIADNGNLRITGTGTLAVRTDKITGETTQQGQGAGEAIFADSYVTFAVLDVGSAGSGADAGTATKVSLNTSALDTITNFDVATDKLLLRKFDASGAVGEKYANSDAFAGSKADALFVDAEGNTLSVGVANGIISFTTASSAEITLEQKLYAASVAFNAETGKIGGFAHGGDFYVIANGSGGTSTTDDLVIKLAGVGGITDIGAILG
ncbi:MAG: hypothetical protein K2N54_01545, partial [Helicobacter sp.]|nr:hypothetical protein [Helicobacter sp.]